MADLSSAIDAAKSILLAQITTLHDPGSTPPENIRDFPILIVDPGTGTWSPLAANQQDANHAFSIEIHSLLRSFTLHRAEMIGYGDQVRNVLFHPDYITLNATVSQVVRIQYRYGRMVYGQLPTFGWEFLVPIRVKD